MEDKIEWNNDLITGNVVVDTQHRLIFSMCNKIIEESETTDMKAIWKELQHYTETHFHDEELLMAEVKYPEIVKHRHMHMELRNKIEDLKEKIEPGTLSSMIRLKKTLLTWWKKHILEEDIRFISFYKEHSK